MITSNNAGTIIELLQKPPANVLLVGAAGSGKSYLLNEVREHVCENEEDIQCEFFDDERLLDSPEHEILLIRKFHNENSNVVATYQGISADEVVRNLSTLLQNDPFLQWVSKDKKINDLIQYVVELERFRIKEIYQVTQENKENVYPILHPIG